MNRPHKQEWLTTKGAFLAVIFVGILAMATRDSVDPDMWWHLKTGQLIVQTGVVPRVDSFSFTRAGYPWVGHEWLSELLIYGVYRVSGLGGLIVVFAAIVSVTFAFVYMRSAPRPYCSGVITLVGAWATAPLWGVRPQMISLLLASLWLLILERSEHNRPLLWWTLPLTLLWVNLHAGFALGLALILLFLIGEAIEPSETVGQFVSSQFSGNARLRALGVTFLLDMILVVLNPNSFKMYFYPIETLRSKAVRDYIAEWASPNFHRAEYIPFLLLLLATTASLACSRIRPRARDILLLVVSTFAALSSIRLIPFFVLIAVPILSREIALPVRADWPSVDRTNVRSRGWRVPAPYSWLLNAVILLFVAGFVGLQAHWVAQRQPEVEAGRFPARAVAYLRAHPAPGPLFNLYDWGGYLIWKSKAPVFIDGRADLYGPALLQQFGDTYGLKGDWQNTLKAWRIGTVLVDPGSALAVALEQDPDWKVRYADSRAVLLEQTLPEPPSAR